MVNWYARTGQYPKRVEKLVHLEAGYDWSAPVFFKAFGKWAQFINTWIELKRRDGTIDALYATGFSASTPSSESRAGRLSAMCCIGSSDKQRRA